MNGNKRYFNSYGLPQTCVGTCESVEVIEHFFGSVSEFARQVELNGNNFNYKNIKVIYNEDTDVHSFFYI